MVEVTEADRAAYRAYYSRWTSSSLIQTLPTAWPTIKAGDFYQPSRRSDSLSKISLVSCWLRYPKLERGSMASLSNRSI